MISVIVAASLAATPIRLEEVRLQSRNNTQALQAELDRRRAQEAVRSARSALLPQVNLGATVGGGLSGPQRFYTTVPVVDETTGAFAGYRQEPVDIPATGRGTFDFNISVSQMIYDAGRWALLAQAGAQADVAAGQAYEQQLTSELEGIRRFYQLYRTQRTLEVLQARVADDQSLVERASALFEAGKRRREDPLNAQVNLGNDRIAAILQRSQIASAGTDLATWLARSPGEELSAVDPGTLSGPPVPAPPLDKALALARERRPLIKSLQVAIHAAEEGIAAARAAYLPRLSLSANYDRNSPTPDPFFTDLRKQNNVSANLTLSWNLFSGFQTQSQVEDARLQQEKARLTFVQAQRDLEGEVAKALVALQTQIEATQVADANRQLAREGLLLAQERYAAGAATTLEIRDAQLKVTNAELSFLESRIDVEVARAALERSMGTLSMGVSQ